MFSRYPAGQSAEPYQAVERAVVQPSVRKLVHLVDGQQERRNEKGKEVLAPLLDHTNNRVVRKEDCGSRQ